MHAPRRRKVSADFDFISGEKLDFLLGKTPMLILQANDSAAQSEKWSIFVHFLPSSGVIPHQATHHPPKMSGPVGDVQKRLRDCVEESLKIPCDCVLVLDSSHSISHSDFETMRRAAMKIVEIGVNGSRFGIVNFSSHAQIVSPLCSNKPHLLNALESTHLYSRPS